MKPYNLAIWIGIFLICTGAVDAQTNLLENGSFEWNYPVHYPRFSQELSINPPHPWMEFNPGDDERWYTDSIWTAATQNDPNPGFQVGFYSTAPYNTSFPWNNGNSSMQVMSASRGRCYVGFDAFSDGFSREGIQTRIQGNCSLNSGEYNYSIDYARTFGGGGTPKMAIYLSESSNQRRRRLDRWKVGIQGHNSGEWYNRSGTFELKLNRNKDRGNRWVSVTGKTGISSNPQRYVYIDDFRLWRPCDVDNACFPATGQICPRIAVQLPPAIPFKIYDIKNANTLQLRISNSGGAILVDTTYTNPNGLPDFYWPAQILGANVASGNYVYEISLSNKCGALQESGAFMVQNGVFDTIAPWIDTTAFWSEVPVPCCLDNLTLQSIELNGNLSYIVKDSIWIGDGVTVAPGSDVLIQAGQVVELDSVEFDGTLAEVTILEAPCVGCRMAGRDEQLDFSALENPRFGAVVGDAGKEKNQGQLKNAEALAKSQSSPLPRRESDAGNEIRFRAYPNPFRERLNIELELVAPTEISIGIFTGQMHQIHEVLPQEKRDSGVHLFSVALSDDLPAGIYFVQLNASGGVYTHMVVRQ